MTDRILSIIKYLHLSPSDFAEEIGVQRSSISHLISGRNKPSLEFIQKILTRYPDINTEWLLSEKGEMLRNGFEPVNNELDLEDKIVNNKKEIPEPEKRDISRIISRKKTVDNEEKQVEKIIYLYKDKTFREYFPE